MNGQDPAPTFWSALMSRFRRTELDLSPYRRMALQLHYALPRSSAPRSVLVVSPSSPVHAAHASTTLAQSIAEELKTPVLLADASPHDPEMTRVLGAAANRGFSDCIVDSDMSLEPLLLRTSDPNVEFLPIGRRTDAAKAPGAEQVVPFLRNAGERYDFVVLSGGSVLGNPMALALAPHVGSVILLAIENQTRMQDLDAAEEALAMCKAARVALVLTTEVNLRLRQPSENAAPASALVHQE